MDNNLKIDAIVRSLAQMSIDKSSLVLAKIINVPVKIELDKVFSADVTEMTAAMNEQESRMLAAFIKINGEAPFHFLFMADEPASLLLTDLMLKKPVGTNKEIGRYVRSTVQEIANILSSAIAGMLSNSFQMSLRASTPRVAYDFAGTVFQEFMLEAMSDTDQIVVMENIFRLESHDIKCSMYIIPESGMDKVLKSKFNGDKCHG